MESNHRCMRIVFLPLLTLVGPYALAHSFWGVGCKVFLFGCLGAIPGYAWGLLLPYPPARSAAYKVNTFPTVLSNQTTPSVMTCLLQNDQRTSNRSPTGVTPETGRHTACPLSPPGVGTGLCSDMFCDNCFPSL